MSMAEAWPGQPGPPPELLLGGRFALCPDGRKRTRTSSRFRRQERLLDHLRGEPRKGEHESRHAQREPALLPNRPCFLSKVDVSTILSIRTSATHLSS